MRSTFAAAFLAAACPLSAVAQQRVAGSDTLPVRLPVVTVSATRTPVRVLDVPLAVTVRGGDALHGGNGIRVEEALQGVPGVLAQSRYGTGDVRITIRGFGARGAGDRSNAGTTRGIRIVQDGVPETEPDGRTSLDLVDLAAVQTVEVVRSNASALWGNAAGGLVSFSTEPAFERGFVRAEQAGGSWGLERTVVQGGTRMGSGQVYGTAIRTRMEGWRANSATERTLVTLGATARAGENTTLRVHALAADNAFQIPGPLTLAALEADPRQANATYLQRRERRHNRLARLSVGLDHGVGQANEVSAVLFAQPKYLQRSERGTYRDFNRYHVGGSLVYLHRSTFSPRLANTLAIGGDEAYQDGAILFYGLTADGERATDLRNNKREAANSLGTFVENRLSIDSRVDVVLGARWDAVTYTYSDYILPRLNDSRRFRRVTPKAGLLLHLAPTRSVYANVGGGVEVPAGNETDPAGTFGQDTVTALNPLLEPIHSTTVEAGLKEVRGWSGGWIRELAYDVAVYRTGVSNEIVPYRGGRFYFTAARAERRGAELGLRIRTAPGVSVEGAFTAADNRYRDYAVDSVHYGRPGAIADYDGNKVVGVPDRFYSLGLRWAPPAVGQLELGVAMQGVGRYFADDANLVEVPGYRVLGASLSLRQPLRLPGGRLALSGSIRGENLTDRRYVGSAFLNPDVVNGVPVAFEPGMPRSVVVSFALQWGR
ncbi:MAG TPA: TonB-dependent receptor [Longimicrobiaceae bacterium]|nr:TonB-dependent receptor [Longimicrobiaceae bacterium]